jgi:hypothetical protein
VGKLQALLLRMGYAYWQVYVNLLRRGHYIAAYAWTGVPALVAFATFYMVFRLLF